MERLPLESFPRPRHIHHKLLKNVYRNRMEGPFIGYKKIQVPLLSDLHIAAALLHLYRTPCDHHPAWDNYMTVFRRHMDKYFEGVDCFSIAENLQEERNIESLRTVFTSVHS